MADPVIQAGSEILSGAPIPFRFEVTWNSLTRDLTPAALGTIAPPRPKSLRDADAREWEMVLPRMRRPTALAPPAPKQLQPAVEAPQFMIASDPVSPRRWIGAVAAALLLAVGGAAYQFIGQHTSQSSTVISGIEMGGAGWITEWAAGSDRARQLALYRPSMSMSDYRLDFLGRIERKSLGWVFRAANSSNYYAAKLALLQPGSQTLTITRFAVIHGVEGSHIQRILRLPPGAVDMLKVRLEARGPRFTVSVQNQVVEDWEDDRLKTGAVGFLNERHEQGQVASVQIAFAKGGTR